MDWDNTPILKGLERYKNESIKRFHMPGHFGIENEYIAKLKENFLDYDVTEVYGTDNLINPEEMIKEALDKLKKAYDSEESFFLVNGSTAGIYSMIDAVTNVGDKIIVGRNCHKSVYNIGKLKSLKLVYVYPEIQENTGLDIGFSLNDIKNVMEENPDCKVVILTYPNYWGICYDIEKISEYIHSKGMLLLVDEAHGAHLNFGDKLPKSSLELGGDIVVQSTHKMLPALTQTAIIHCRKNLSKKIVNSLRDGINIFNSSSPSYLLLASIDSSRAYMEENGKGLLDKLYSDIEEIRIKYEDNEYVKIIKTQDYCKMVLHTTAPGDIVDKKLRIEYKIQSEMVLGNNILFILGVSRSMEDIIYIIESSIAIVKELEYKTEEGETKIVFPKLEKAMEVYEVDRSKLKRINIEDGKGKVLGERIVPFPPGIPLVLEGEIISEEAIEVVKYLGLSKEVMIYE